MPCAINATMLSAESAWRGVLREKRLSDLLVDVARSADVAILERAASWVCTWIR